MGNQAPFGKGHRKQEVRGKGLTLKCVLTGLCFKCLVPSSALLFLEFVDTLEGGKWLEEVRHWERAFGGGVSLAFSSLFLLPG